jgi:hypothetical protein
VTDKSKGGTQRQPWHYDAIEGRPQWSKELARRNVMQRQLENALARKAQGRERN